MTFGIESSNIVGYTNKDADAGKFIMLGAQFEQIGGGTSVNGLVTGLSGVDYDEEYAFTKTAPQIQIPNGAGYITLYYLNDGWFNKDPMSEEGDWVQKAGWCDLDGLIVDTEYTPGVAIWLKSVASDVTVNVAGAVPAESTVEIECPTTFAMRANAFPMPVALNSEKMVETGIVGVAWDEAYAFVNTAPQVQIPNGAGYITRYYLADGWFNKDPMSEEGNWIQKAGWCDLDGLIVDDVIPAAQGFWTKGVNATFKLVFTR